MLAVDLQAPPAKKVKSKPARDLSTERTDADFLALLVERLVDESS